MHVYYCIAYSGKKLGNTSRRRMITVEHCGALKKIVSLFILRNVWYFNKWGKHYNSVFYLKKLFIIYCVYIWSKKGIIILIHGIEDKEGIKVICFSFSYFLIITLILAKMLLLSFMRKSLRNMEKVFTCSFIITW